MAPLSLIGALSVLPLAFAHMQMSSPSPLRDPHADRLNEPKDYNILNPLKADGSDFACKGYHLNTPLTTVATYEAGSKQTLRLKGSATHGGGSCQISLSCDGGSKFNVLKSMIGGCPLKRSYDFTIPSDIPAAKQCLLAWSWFNRIGNREMYMNCAVVDITNKRRSKRDTQAAAKALSRYPEIFVANLANINSCKTKETTDVIFDDPGRQVDYGNGDNALMRPSFGRGECIGRPLKNVGDKDAGLSYSGDGDSGSWPSQGQSKQQQQGDNCEAKIRDGQWHPECSGGSSRTTEQQQQPAQQQEQQQQIQQNAPRPDVKQPNRKKPNTKVQQELDAYLATLYGRGLARRNVLSVDDYAKDYKEDGYPTQPHPHKEDCKHKTTGYPPSSYHHDQGLDPYYEDGVDHPSEDDYHTQYSPEYEYSNYPNDRATRQKRWASYAKRADGPRTPIRFHRGDEREYYQQQASAKAAAQKAAEENIEASAQTLTQISTQESAQGSTQESTQASAQTSDNASSQKSWNDMSDAEKFEAFLRRMVELSTNMASLIKYAAASTVNIPYYPPESTYASAATVDGEYPQKGDGDTAPKHARRGVLSSYDSPLAQVYPGPAVGGISASGDATDSEEGFKAWFPNLVQGLMTKRQLVDPVTSEASAEAGDSVNILDALLAGFWNAFGDPFSLYSDEPDFDPEPTPETIPLVLGEPDFYSGHPAIDFPDFEIPDLDGDFTFPPQILPPLPPLPESLPGYTFGPDGPVWVGEGPDPLTEDPSSDGMILIISSDPIDASDAIIYPGEDIPIFSTCTEPIPQVGFNSCLGGCNHTAEEIAAHDVYLEEFAKEQAEYEECLKDQALDAILADGPLRGIFPDLDSAPFADDDGSAPSQAEDASGRRPRPGKSQPLIPDPSSLDLTKPDTSTSPSLAPLDGTAPTSNETDEPAELQPYQNKTLGELVSEILNNPDILGPLSTDEASEEPSEGTNPLQEAANQAEAGVTVPTTPNLIDPNALESIADALPWFMGPGPVVTSDVPDDAPPVVVNWGVPSQ